MIKPGGDHNQLRMTINSGGTGAFTLAAPITSAGRY
jgi:hypothetical protein